MQPAVAKVEVGNLRGSSAELGEQPVHGRGALDPELRAELSAMVEGHDLCRGTAVDLLFEVTPV